MEREERGVICDRNRQHHHSTNELCPRNLSQNTTPQPRARPHTLAPTFPPAHHRRPPFTAPALPLAGPPSSAWPLVLLAAAVAAAIEARKAPRKILFMHPPPFETLSPTPSRASDPALPAQRECPDENSPHSRAIPNLLATGMVRVGGLEAAVEMKVGRDR